MLFAASCATLFSFPRGPEGTQNFLFLINICQVWEGVQKMSFIQLCSLVLISYLSSYQTIVQESTYSLETLTWKPPGTEHKDLSANLHVNY